MSGERLITRDLTAVWRTSLTPVREAMLKLVVLEALERPQPRRPTRQ